MIPQHPSGPRPVHDAPHQILVVVFQDAFRDDTEAVGEPEVNTVNPWGREFRVKREVTTMFNGPGWMSSTNGGL